MAMAVSICDNTDTDIYAFAGQRGRIVHLCTCQCNIVFRPLQCCVCCAFRCSAVAVAFVIVVTAMLLLLLLLL